jgi:gas vesicle protein GvpL/GvpF
VTLYLYAVVDRLPARWRPPKAGVGGASVVPWRLGAPVVLASVLDAVPVPTPRTLAAHQDVVATVLDATAAWPFRYGTTIPVTGLADWLETNGRLVATVLASVRGCVEVTVKLLRLDAALVQQSAGRERPRVGAPPADGGEHELHVLAEALAERAGVRRWRYQPSGHGGNVTASAAFLVPRADVPGFLARIAPVASHTPGIAVVPTGPAPPYSFVPETGPTPLGRCPDAGPVATRHAG